MTAPATPLSFDTQLSSGGRLVAPDGRALPLEGTALRAEASGGVARVVLEQRFRNRPRRAAPRALQLPLPPTARSAAIAFRIGDRRIVGEVDRRQAARERFEQALVEGRTRGAARAGAIEPVHARRSATSRPAPRWWPRSSIDQRLRWLDEGAWEWRFPTVVAPRYLGEAGRVADAERVVVDVADPGAPLARGRSFASRSATRCPRAARRSRRRTRWRGRRRRAPRRVVFWLRGRRRPARPRRGGALAGGDRPGGRLARHGRGPSPGGRAGGDCGFGLLTVVPPEPGARAGAAARPDRAARHQRLDERRAARAGPARRARADRHARRRRSARADRVLRPPRRWKRGRGVRHRAGTAEGARRGSSACRPAAAPRCARASSRRLRRRARARSGRWCS